MDDKVLSYILNRFEIKKESKIYDIKYDEYISFSVLKSVLKSKCGVSQESDIDLYVTNLILYWTNDVDIIFNFYHVHSDVEFIPYYSVI